MNNRLRPCQGQAVLVGLIFTFALLSTRAQTYNWADNAQGQLYETCAAPYYWPSNNLWTQSFQTNSNCNNTGTVESAPSNWDPTPPIGLYPGGPGLTGVDVVLGAPANTFLSSGASLSLNSITIGPDGSLGIGANWAIGLNRLEFQGDGQLLTGVGGFEIGNGGTLIKSAGTNVFNIVNPSLAGTNVLVEVDFGTLMFPASGVYLDGGTFAISNNATLVLTASNSAAAPILNGNLTGVGGGTVLFSTGVLTSMGCSLNLPTNMFQWTAGSLKGGPFTNLGVINITNVGPQFYGGATLYNENLILLAPNSGLDFFSPSGAAPVLYNEAGATFNIQGDDSFTTGSGGIYNLGLFIKSAGTGLSQISPAFNCLNGTIEVDSGTLDLNVKTGASYSNATFVVNNTATLLFLTNNVGLEMDGTITASGGGTILMNNGTVASVYPTTLDFPGAMFQWAGGRLGDSASNTEVNVGTINVTGPVGILGHLANSGTMIQSGAGSIGSGNFLYNYTNALYDIQDDGGISVGTLYNYGLFRKSAGTNTSVIAGNFINYGTNAAVEVDSGVLALSGSGGNYFTNTTLAISNAATLDLSAVTSANTEVEGSFAGVGGGTLLMTNGTLLCLQPTTLNFPGSMFQWSGGKVGSANNNLTNLGAINIGGSVGVNNYLVNSGTMLQSGNGAITSGYQFQNNAGGVYNLQNDQGITVSYLYNYGQVRKSGGVNTSVITGNFYNYGGSVPLEVDSGTLALTGSGGNYLTNTTLAISTGATFDLSAVTSASTEVEGSFAGVGGGTLLMTNGTLLCLQPTTLNFPGAMFQWLGGKIGSANNNLTNAGTINVGGPVSLNTYLMNNGTMLQSGNGALTSGYQFQNNAGGVYNFQNDNGITISYLYNYGQIRKSGGVNTSVITGNFYNYGGSVPLEVDSGTLALTGSGGNYLTNTILAISNAATFDLNAATTANLATDVEGSFTGVGSGTLLMTNGTLLCNQPTTLNFPGPMFQWLGGKIGSANNNLTNVGTINVGGPVSVNTYFVNSGTMLQSGNGAITGGSQLQNNAGGNYNIEDDSGIAANTFNNFGVFEKTAGTGTSLITSTFNNSGVINGLSGVLLFTNGTFGQNAGTLQLSASVLCQGAIQENGGVITGVGMMGNTGAVGMTVNGGVVAPGNPFGTLSWIGHFGFSMGSAAAFSVVLGGSNSFGQLQVPNTSATVAGTLNVTLTNGYTPPIGTQFQIISASSRAGTFAKLNVPTGISVTYSNTGVFLTVTGAVPAQITQPQLAGGNFAFDFGTVSNQSYTVQQNTNLATTNWTFYTNFIGDGSIFQFLTPVTNFPQNFFRVRQP